MTSLALADIKDSKNTFNMLLDLVKSERASDLQVKLFKEIVYIFFRVDDLSSYFNKNLFRKFDEKLDTENVEARQKALIQKTLFSLHKFLKEGNADEWIKCLEEEEQNFRDIQDFNGYIFAQINQHVARYFKTENVEVAKALISKLAKNLNNDQSQNKPPEKILNEMIERLKASMEMYNEIFAFEEELKARDRVR